MGEICLGVGNSNLAIKAIRRDKRYEIKINMLIECEAWLEAVEEIFSNRKHAEFEMLLDKVREKGPPFVEDFIREAQQKKK